MGEFSLTHWIVILVILLVLFGPSKLPGLGKGMGEAIRGFKKGLNEDHPTVEATDPNRRLADPLASPDPVPVKKDEKLNS